jgi:hypothetical protein
MSDIEKLRKECAIGNRFLGLVWSGLHIVTLREKGDPALHRLWLRVLAAHQGEKYREGLSKLGISENEPPAIIAAKYHYFTNIMGGLKMDYIEESPKKVWIRYLSPMWTYPGVAMLAVPTNIRRTGFSGWHPYNGKLMGCSRLGWVATKFITEGYPYDEGYFIEHDHDLAPGEEMRYEVVQKTPECDRTQLPTLDPEIWPEARQLKAHRNWSKGYVRTTIQQLQLMYGENTTNYIVSEVMRGLAIQYADHFRQELRLADNSVKSVAATFEGVLTGCTQNVSCQRIDDSHYQLVLKSFEPFDTQAPENLRLAFFQFYDMATRVLNGRVRITRRVDADQQAGTIEVWDLRDTGQWLW